MDLGRDKIFTKPQLRVYGTGAVLLALAYVTNVIAAQFDVDPNSSTHVDTILHQSTVNFFGFQSEPESIFGYRANLIIEAAYGLLFVAAALSYRANRSKNQPPK